MTTSSLIILLVASLSLTLFAQDCNNPLLNIYGFQGLDAPQSGADLPYCDELKTGQTCCSADTVDTFQSKLDDLIDKLNNYDAARDLYIAQLKNSFLDRFRDLLDDINDLRNNLQVVRQVNPALADQLQSEIDSFSQINNETGGIDDQFAEAMNDLQKARKNCFTTALQVKASSWCLACDPNYATLGVTPDGTVTFSGELCEELNDACWPYFNQSARFNPLIRAREVDWRLAAVARYLKNVSDTGQVGDFNLPADPYNPLSTQRAVTVPDQWIPSAEETSTTEQCQDLWAGDKLLVELLTIGNSVPAETVETIGENELVWVEEEASVNTRLLANALAEWFPILIGTGLNVDELFSDPGDLYDLSDLTDITDDVFD